MTSRRRPLAIAVIALAPFALAGCQQPTPSITAFSGTSSVQAPAICWQPADGQSLGPKQCADEALARASAGEGIPRLEVAQGNTVGISVDPAIAAGGWTVMVAGQQFATGLKDTYFRFTFPELIPFQPTGYTLQVIAEAQPAPARGYWFMQLVPPGA